MPAPGYFCISEISKTPGSNRRITQRQIVRAFAATSNFVLIAGICQRKISCLTHLSLASIRSTANDSSGKRNGEFFDLTASVIFRKALIRLTAAEALNSGKVAESYGFTRYRTSMSAALLINFFSPTFSVRGSRCPPNCSRIADSTFSAKVYS